jgi:hypothetical protein
MGARLISLLAVLITVSALHSQVLENGERKGLIQATASFYPSWMLNHQVQNNYLAGHVAYYFDDHYSFRGEALVYIDAQGENKIINDHVQIQAGFGRHFPVKRWDPFLYGQMGLAMIQVQGFAQRHYQPAAGLTIGTHYHVSRFFYFFAECSYTHMQDPSQPGRLDQFLVSGGLGFQLTTRKM